MLNNKSTYLVLGGGGFIGAHLISALLEQGHYVRCFDRANVKGIENGWHNYPNFKFFSGDITDTLKLSEVLDGVDICYHLVSTTLPKSSNVDPIYDIETNLVATVKLMDQCLKFGVKKIIFTSSGGTVYGKPLQVPIDEAHPTDPQCSYGISKLAIEKYLELYRILYGLNYAVLRLANPFGERQRVYASQGVVAVFAGKVLRGETIEIWGDGSVIRDYIYISDVINALVLASEHEGHERVFNIGSGSGRSINEVIDCIEVATGVSACRKYLASRDFDVPASVLSISKAQQHLGWMPKVTFEQGVDTFVQWLKANPNILCDGER